jgi:hypothetical protein
MTTNPSSQTVAEGATVSFTAVATGNGTLTYAWGFPTRDTDVWAPVAPLAMARQSHHAVSFASGSILIVGGLNNVSSAVFGVESGEVYDLVGNAWSPAVPMAVGRQRFTTVPLADGRVRIVGGDPNYEGVPEFYR